MAEPIRVIVADDHPLFREGVVGSIDAANDMCVVGEASDAAGALWLAEKHAPDIAILDVMMPGGGLQAARQIKAACPNARVVMLTVSEDEDDLLEAMAAGASGYVLKGVSADELLTIVRAVHQGEVYVSPALAWQLLGERARPRPVAGLSALTTREHDVLALLTTGLCNQEIGERLGLTEKTVKHYMTSILNKLQVRSRLEAALVARRAGFASPPEREG